MWLPEEIYKQMAGAIASPNESTNELTTVISVRKLLLKERAGRLSSENIAHHAPGIGKNLLIKLFNARKISRMSKEMGLEKFSRNPTMSVPLMRFR